MRSALDRRLTTLERAKRHTTPSRERLNPEALARIADYLVDGSLIGMDQLKPMLGAAYE